jgi:hypothetical protein
MSRIHWVTPFLLSYIHRYVSFAEVGRICRAVLREPMHLCTCVSEEGGGSRFCVPNNPKWRKTKKLFGGEKWWIRQERWWEFQLHSQEGQDFSVAAASSRLITHKSSESRSLDLTNNGMDNHYLTDVDHGSHCVARHRTASLTYMSD